MSSPGRAAGSPTPEMLTPRSKIAKMLADIDNGPTPSPPPSRTTTTVPHLAPRTNESLDLASTMSAAGQSTRRPASIAGSAASSNDESEDDVRKPIGRAARRMLAQRNVEGDLSQTSSPPLRASFEVDARHDEEDLYSATPVKAQTSQTARSPAASEGGLFVSPAKSVREYDDDDDHEEDLPSNPFGSKEKLAELVAQKRQERLQRKQVETEQRIGARSDAASEDGGLDDHDPEIERIMSDAARPTRKASKRAMLEMERETQRISRQQALAHQMKVKKKFSTTDLFARFNFRQARSTKTSSGDASTSSAPNSDPPEAREPVSTPPSSPPTPFDRQKALVEQGALSKLVPVREDSLASLSAMVEDDGDLPSVEEVLRVSQVKSRSDAQRHILEDTPAQPKRSGREDGNLHTKRASRQNNSDASDDDLEIVDRRPTHLKHFDKARALGASGKESKALHALRHLSRIGAYDEIPTKRGARPSMNLAALEIQLRRRAKQQAHQEELERIAELKFKGIEVQTTEQREREAEAFESLLEKARHDAETLRKTEKAALKAANGNEGKLEASEDESEDEEYIASGSEHEEVADNDEDEDERSVYGAADEIEEVGPEHSDATMNAALEAKQQFNTTNDEHVPGSTPARFSRKLRKSRVIVDEDDEDMGGSQDVPDMPADIEDDPFAAFGFGADSALLSPTQAFNATMRTPTQGTQEGDSFDMLRRIAPPSMSSFPPTMVFDDMESQPRVVQGSQVPESQRIDLGWETQPAELLPPETPSHSLTRDVSGLTETPGWEPTQDAGLSTPTIPNFMDQDVGDSAVDNDTQATIVMRVSESPMASVAPRRSRLIRRQAALVDSDDEQEGSPQERAASSSAPPAKTDAFREMSRLRKEALTDSERAEAQKDMKGMMDEQAEESEDEYTGLGGDDYVAPETEEDKAMIDESHVDVDERQIAAVYAERQRAADEAATTKLYKDLTTGALRRKQANVFDLDEDEDEVAMRKRQMRQREEARKRKLLLRDDNIASLVQGKPNKGKDAFLKAIADDGGDEDLLNLSGGEDDFTPDTQEESQEPTQRAPAPHTTEVLQEISGNKRRPGDELVEERPPAKQRRTEASALRRPTSLLEVKQSVSFLLDEPNAALFGPSMFEDVLVSGEADEHMVDEDEQDGDDDDDGVDQEEARNNDGGFAPDPSSFDSKIMPPPRLPAAQRRTKADVIDRLSLKRNLSSSSEGGAGSRSAWAASTTTNTGVSRTPSLLRRATSAASANDHGVTTLTRENSGSSSGSGVKMGGSKKSSLAYQARAEEHKLIVEASKRRKEENTKRIAGLRRQQSGGMLGGNLGGTFE